MSKPNLICQKTRKSFRSLSLSLGLFILVIDELWPDRRTSCGKKWMVLTQLGWKRKQRSSRVLNMNQCIINIIERRKKIPSLSNLILQLDDRIFMYVYFIFLKTPIFISRIAYTSAIDMIHWSWVIGAYPNDKMVRNDRIAFNDIIYNEIQIHLVICYRLSNLVRIRKCVWLLSRSSSKDKLIKYILSYMYFYLCCCHQSVYIGEKRNGR